MKVPEVQHVQAKQHRTPRRRWGPALAVAALVAVLSFAVAAPALAAGPPTVTNIIPRHATSAGGTSVTIIGENLSGATAVKFGEINAASFIVNSNTMITAVSPPRTGTATVVDVTVTTPEGTSPPIPGELEKFHYLLGCQEGHAPAVTGVEPHSGSAGTSVTINGERFFQVVCTSEGFSVERVLFGFTEATSFKFPKEGEIVAVAPPGTGTVDVTVESFLGQSPVSPQDRYTYEPSPPPAVSRVEPNHGSPGGGSTVTITGTGFTGATAVKFGATSAKSFTVNSATSITAVSPKVKGTSTVDVTVTTPAGTSPTSAADQFTFSRK
jgi:hypothetical protein